MTTPPPAPPGEREQKLVQQAMHVVAECAADLAPRWSRFVSTPEELYAVGTFALYRVAHQFRDEVNPDFVDLARRRVRGAMRDSLRLQALRDRQERAVANAADQFLGEHRDRGFNVLVHHEEEAEKRLDPFLQRVLAATFAAGIDEVLKYKGEDAAAVHQEYAQAITALRRALPRLERAEVQVILLVYSKGHTLDEVCETLGIGYNTARRRHESALDRLFQLLVSLGVDRAPPPLDLPGMGTALPANEVEEPAP